MLLLLAACTGAGPTPTETAQTAETGTGTPPGALPVTTDRFEGCPDPSDYTVPPDLSASAAGSGEVAVDYTGPVGGCGCAGEVRARTEDPDVLAVRIDAGDCDAIFCCEVEATIRDVPAGTWTLQLWGYAPVSTDVTVP